MFPTTTNAPINPMLVTTIMPLLRGDVERRKPFTHEAVLAGGARVALTATEANDLQAEVTAILEAIRKLSMTSIVAQVS